ncbi:MAG: hypothetical protein WD738_11540 [Pirellulales bacterium]
MRRVGLKIVACILVVALGVGGWAIHRSMEGVRNAYAVWWVADMVVEHLKANNGAWPRNWDELRDDYQTCVERSGQPWSFEELQNRVAIDWRADPSQLAALANRDFTPPFCVIWLSDGTNSHWEHAEPNQIIADYLKSPG